MLKQTSPDVQLVALPHLHTLPVQLKPLLQEPQFVERPSAAVIVPQLPPG